MCFGIDDLPTDQAPAPVVCRYNHSREYGKLVLSIAASNSCGDYTIVPTRHRVRQAAHSTMAVIYQPVPSVYPGTGAAR
jgi:alpha-D-ribose 1-methylphosphonate 5-phosphate C-P lyase